MKKPVFAFPNHYILDDFILQAKSKRVEVDCGGLLPSAAFAKQDCHSAAQLGSAVGNVNAVRPFLPASH